MMNQQEMKTTSDDESCYTESDDDPTFSDAAEQTPLNSSNLSIEPRIVTGGGPEKYPASSFVLNSKGDACTGDVVIFEQNVYDMFNIASRSATGPPCGTRLVAGRTVKESYGVAKQQHTFTPTFGVGSGINPHAMNFSGDAYGMPDHPKKASVPNWLREEIIKNKAVITGKRFRKRLLFKNFS